MFEFKRMNLSGTNINVKDKTARDGINEAQTAAQQAVSTSADSLEKVTAQNVTVAEIKINDELQDNEITALKSRVGTGALNTIAQNLTAAVNELLALFNSIVLDLSNYALSSSIATVETNPATANHAVGDYIVYNGQSYRVTSAITSGTTLTGKITAVSVGERHSTKNILSQVTAGTNVNIRAAYVSENFSAVTVSVQFDVTGTAKTNGEVIISGIPSEYRPINNLFALAQGNPTDAPVTLSGNGNITAGGRGVSVGTWYSVSFTFPR